MTEPLTSPIWRKSSYSSSNSNCVEVAAAGPDMAVRDSKDPDGPVLACPRAGMGAFLAEARSNQETPR